jgi:peptidoglycan/xylan/chitin deacetylase (PgdA/CDA1 family)/GT2 family glycosyltransferase
MTSGDFVALSVIVASHNRCELLRRCLTALTRQTQDPTDFEVIVADDGSSDGTAAMAEAFEAPFRLRVLSLEKGGQAKAQNAAIEAAQGNVCLFIDDDVVASPQLVAEHIAGHRSGRIVGIGSLPQKPVDARDWYAHTFARAWNTHYDELESRPANWRDCYGGNLSAGREALIEVGGFTSGMRTGDDTELGFRLLQAGCTPTYLPLAKGVHDDQKRRAQLINDARRIGAGSIELIGRHPGMLPIRLGGFAKVGPRQVSLRRLLIALRIPPAVPAAIGPLIPGAHRQLVWYRFVSKYAVWLGVRTATDRTHWKQITRGLPILMYHAFTEGGKGSRYVQTKRSFARQMALLRILRYRVVSLEELAEALRKGHRLPGRAVILTSDDGYEDNLQIAQPILRKRNFPMTIFLVSKLLGRSNEWTEDGPVAGRALFSAAEAKQAQADGIEFGAHTRRHVSLPHVDDSTVSDEVAGSREDLESTLGGPIKTFAYPYGRFDDRAVAVTGEAGFEMALTVENRLASIAENPMLIPRIEIRGTDSLLSFLRKLWFGNT